MTTDRKYDIAGCLMLAVLWLSAFALAGCELSLSVHLRQPPHAPKPDYPPPYYPPLEKEAQ